MRFEESEIREALKLSWSSASARQWQADNPALGQCNVTAILLQELFGGQILKTPLPEGDHFYNCIDGRHYDFSDSQFVEPIHYQDQPSSASEARQAVRDSELAALRRAFESHYA